MVFNTRFRRVGTLAALLLLTSAAMWLWAHEGHTPLPSKGAQVDVGKGLIVLTQQSREALDVQTAEVESRSLPDYLSASVTLVSPWSRHGFASARLPGRITAIHVQAGQSVAAGQILAEIASLELENLSVEIRNAKNDARLAESILKIVTASAGAETGIQILNAKTRLQQSRNAADMAKAKWLSLGLPLTGWDAHIKDRQVPLTLPVRSPVAGTVIHADLAVGKVVEPGEHLFEVVDLSKVWAKIDVLEHDLPRVFVGQPVELRLTSYPGERFQSTIQVKGLAFESQSNRNAVWAEFVNAPSGEPGLLPGMTGQAQMLQPAMPGSKVVPAAALINDGLDRYVMVETASAEQSSEYQKIPVSVLRQTPEWVEIHAAGLYPGTRVVTRGAHELGSFFVPGLLRIRPETAKTIGLKVESVQTRIVEQVVELEGAIDLPPDHRTTASASLNGVITRIHVDVGEDVKAGQLLAEVASIDFQNLQLDLLKEQFTAQLLDEQYQSQRKLDASVSGRTLMELQSELAAARNRRDSTRRRLEIVGLRPEQIDAIVTGKSLIDAVPIRSAIAGYVVQFDKTLGQAIKADEPIFAVHNFRRPLVQAFVSERDLPRVHVGQAARIRFVADPSAIFTGKVVRSSNIIAEGSQTASLWIELDNIPAEPLRHNQLAQITLTVNQFPPVLTVPLSAIIRDGSQAYVFVKLPNGTFERRGVTIGRVDDRFVEIGSGLQRNESVAVGGTADLWTAYSSLR